MSKQISSGPLRIKDLVTDGKRIGVIWELRPNGRASVVWRDKVLYAQTNGLDDQHSGAKRSHLLLRNLQRVKA